MCLIHVMRFFFGMSGVSLLGASVLITINGGYEDTYQFYIISSISLSIAYLLHKYINKKAYSIRQKEYGIVIISDQWLDFTGEEEKYEDETAMPFYNEVMTFYDTNKVSFIYTYDLESWNTNEAYTHISHDPTFVVITDNEDADRDKANQQPFLITSRPIEVVEFLERDK
ncbi:MAG: hypothetical protein ACI35O_01975 [Bacillaceae bacterium]